MKKIKLYRYVGRNGIVTTPVLLDDIKHYIYYRLSAEEGKILTNTEKKVYFIDIPEEELQDWHEINDAGQM
jgi:hypothetical protein